MASRLDSSFVHLDQMETYIFGVPIDILNLVLFVLLFAALLLIISITAVCVYKKTNLIVPDELDNQAVDRINERIAQDIEMVKTLDKMFTVQRPSDRYKVESEHKTEV